MSDALDNNLPTPATVHVVDALRGAVKINGNDAVCVPVGGNSASISRRLGISQEIVEQAKAAIRAARINPQDNTFIEEAHERSELQHYEGTVRGAAQLLVDTFGEEMLWIQPTKQWWLCSRSSRPGYWSAEDREGAYARALAVCEVLAHQQNRPGLTTPAKVEGVLKTARPSLAGLPSDLNSNPYLLGFPNGVVDLRTGEFNPVVDPKLHLTQTTAYPYEEIDCPTWLDHLRVLTRSEVSIKSDADPELIHYLQVLVGLSLIGRQDAHVFAFLYGPGGRNGKGIFMDTLLEVLGEYADILDQTVLFSKPDAHTTGLADLQGKRFVVADEVTGNKQINTPLLKKLSGGGMIKARHIRKDNVTFTAEHTMWLVSNDRPNFGSDESTGLWDRVILIETGPSIPAEERQSDEWVRMRIMSEAPGILRWAIDGAVEFLEKGLPPRPLRVQMATDELRHDSSMIGRFMDDRCVPSGEMLQKDFRFHFEIWARNEGEIGPHDTIKSRDVGDLLRKRGVVVKKGTGNQNYVQGWSLKSMAWSSK